MTTEESELTFVRCPSCRSLVPAVATRCRMCGHQFTKGEAEAAHDDASQPKSRVRQRTISATKDEVEEIKRQILGGSPAAGSGGASSTGAGSADTASESAESSRASNRGPAPGGKAPSRSVRVVDDDDDVFDDDIDTTYLTKSAPEPKADDDDAGNRRRPSFVVKSSELANASPGEPPSQSRAGTGSLVREEGEPSEQGAEEAEDDRGAGARRAVDWSTDDEEVHGEDEGDDDDESADESAAVSAGGPGAGTGERKRKRRRKKKKGGQQGGVEGGPPLGASGTFPAPGASSMEKESVSTHSGPPLRVDLGKRGAEGRDAGAAAVDLPPERPAQERPATNAGFRVGGREETHAPSFPDTASASEAKAEEPVQAPVQRGNGMSQAEQVFHGPGSGRGDHQASAGAQPSGSEVEGTIIGWLIHFGGDVRGTAIEIRSGKFFLGRQKLRAGDIVVNDSSISTPHCLITSTVGDGLSLQDLMSEQGTFVKRARSDSFQRLDQVTFVEHGDWIRFGGYDVMVCLVPHAQRTRRN